MRRAEALTGQWARDTRAGDDAVATLRRDVLDVRSGDRVLWRVLPLRSAAGHALADVARQTHLPRLTRGEHDALRGLTSDAAAAVRDVQYVVGTRRIFSGRTSREAGDRAAAFLHQYHGWAITAGVPQLLDRLARPYGSPTPVPVADALAEWVGLCPRVSDLGGGPMLLPSSVVADLGHAVRTIDAALALEGRLQADALAAGEIVRSSDVRNVLMEMPVERLRDATRDRLRIGPLTAAGITTVQAVLDGGVRLEHLPGIGSTTATRIRGAAQTLRQTTYDEMPVRIDIKKRTAEVGELLRRLRAWDSMRRIKGAAADLAVKEALTPLSVVLNPAVTHVVVWSCDRSVASFRDAVQTVARRARQVSGAAPGPGGIDPWDDFAARAADYYALLSELGFLTEDEQKSHGDLPDDIVKAVRRVELDAEHLSASLRGYQSFGARFALVQRKVIIGDEMGLGKTVEALAVLAHLRSKGSHHFLVICPAAVVTNWVREVQSKSRLRPHRVHGHGRETAVRSWIRSGGVAVTTFESLTWVEQHVLDLDDLGCVVVDEAHYIKNPSTKRSHRAATLIELSDRAILLTGTPLENRLDEFRNLVRYLRPDLVVDADELAPRRFRQQVAPAYLRRNQEDVLTELPELVEVDEWLPMSPDDAAAYRDAVWAGNFMAMRQAAMSGGRRSVKVSRLVEIVEEAEANGRRVIVFSHFRQVLDQVAATLPGQVFGPLTGSVPAAVRQVMVDQFSAAECGAVLVAQIVAGGVGLNIQAASVVVICEPQLKPTTEWQAIARAHRMGQLESVQVHRLLSEEGVDRRVTEILACKRALFDDFARVSDTAGSAPEAMDISEAELAREVVAAERVRLMQSANAPSEGRAGD